MSWEVAALPFQVDTNYGTWSIDFDFAIEKQHTGWQRWFFVGKDYLMNYSFLAYTFCIHMQLIDYDKKNTQILMGNLWN